MTLHRAAPAPLEDAAGQRFTRLRGDRVELILDTSPGGRPCILYWGTRLEHTLPEELALLSVRQWTIGGPAVDVQSSLSNELGAGLSGPAGFVAHRRSEDWAAIFRIERVEQPSPGEARIHCADPNTRLKALYTLTLNATTNVLTARTRVTNRGAEPVTIEWCAAICMPLERRLIRLLAFTGRWAQEFQEQEVAAFRGSYVRENRSGRTSHDNFPGLIALAKFTSEKGGPAAGFHLGWSGNNRVRVDRHADGRAFVQMGELFYPGEMELASGGSYETPPLYAGWSDEGLNTLSQCFHSHLRSQVMDGRSRSKPRPVHFNTWEAIYFDHSEEKVMALAEQAAKLGAERFVVDDGWFGGRRNERTGLGDWWVSRDVYPNGLRPLVDRVHRLGMEFGIWFVPEMVNPDSDLARQHPDWVFGPADQPLG
ncbi:MAG: alpha-galactosidase, partial [Pseudomonadota bacterium]